LALGYRREKLDLAGKALHFFRKKKRLEKIVSLEEFGNPTRMHKETIALTLTKPPDTNKDKPSQKTPANLTTIKRLFFLLCA
jgi:hypothetical protein